MVLVASLFKTPPTFSPDGRFIAVHAWFVELIQVFDTASGKLCFQTKVGTRSSFPEVHCLGSGIPAARTAGHMIEAPEIVVWSPDGWTEMSFPLRPRRRHRWKGRAPSLAGRSCEPVRADLLDVRRREFGLDEVFRNIADPGLGALAQHPERDRLDLVDGVTGNTRTYHLDGPAVATRTYPFFQMANKILIPRSFETVEVWDIPPRRTYAAAWAMAGMMAAIGILGYVLGSVVRSVAGGIAVGRRMLDVPTNVLDYLANGSIALIVNTPKGKGARTDEDRIRPAAVSHGVPCITTIAGAKAAVAAMERLRAGKLEVYVLQDLLESK